MKLTSILGLTAMVPMAFAQSPNPAFLTGLGQALNTSGLTHLAAAVASINSTAFGQQLLANLPTRNWTIFAPSDAAFKAVAANVSSDANSFANILAYHIVSGNFTGLTATFPNVTLGRTLLSNSSLVSLEGNKSQVVAWTNENGTIQVLNQTPNISVQNVTTFQNLLIYVINGVLEPPGPISTVLTKENLTILNTLVSKLSANSSSNSTGTTWATILEGDKGITIFAPNDAALSAAASTISSLPNTSVANVLENHVINGTTIYSPSLSASPNLTSASGETLSFMTNATGTFVISGSSTARIIKTDVLLKNGVVHIIDAVLVNTASNTAAASSAFASATSIAAQPTTETGPVGTPTNTVSTTRSKDGAEGLMVTSTGGLIGALCMMGSVFAGGLLFV